MNLEGLFSDKISLVDRTPLQWTLQWPMTELRLQTDFANGNDWIPTSTQGFAGVAYAMCEFDRTTYVPG